jgi:peroxiredoxin Q/BCP
MLQVGKTFPDFALPDQDGTVLRSTDFKGKWLVVYSYPKDDTPGCTLEGRGFSAMKPQFDLLNAEVLGLSADDVKSHGDFCGKYGLKIRLLADPDAKLLTAAEVGQSDWKGTMYWNRVTFIVDPQGIVRKVYPKVNPEGHEKEVLEDIRALQVEA